MRGFKTNVFLTSTLAGIAWLIIQDPRFRWADSEAFKYTEWRVFVAACGIPSLLVVLMLLPFPESPRFLLHVNKPEQALQVLQKIFVVNTRLSAKDFPVSRLDNPLVRKYLTREICLWVGGYYSVLLTLW